MVDVTRMPENSFGYVSTPALVAPLELAVCGDDYLTLGGHETAIRTAADVLEPGGENGLIQAPCRYSHT